MGFLDYAPCIQSERERLISDRNKMMSDPDGWRYQGLPASAIDVDKIASDAVEGRSDQSGFFRSQNFARFFR